MKKTKPITALACAIALLLGLSFNAQAASIPKATGFKVVTTTTTAKLTWTKFATGKVSSVRVQAQYGTGKKIKSLPSSATSYTFTGLASNRSYTFSVVGIKGSSVSPATSLKVATKKAKMFNTIFFGQPSDMMMGDPNQELYALPNGGVMTYSTTTPNRCEIVDGVYVKALAIGDCVIIASNAGDAFYAAAVDEERTITISAPLGELNKTLLWSDEFNDTAGSGPNSTDWTIDLGDGCNKPPGCGWGNNESQSYAACAIKHNGSSLIITASTPAGEANCTSNRTWTSGKMITKGKRNFTYGYFESRMKMPSGGGAWPAFWLLGSNIDTLPWPRSGEIDIMEYTGNVPNRTTSAAHYANSFGSHEYKAGAYNNSLALYNDYHTYGMLWLPNELTFYFNGREIFRLTKNDTGLARWPFGPSSTGVDPKMYVIFNLAMGGNYGGGIESGLTKAQLGIDYVRYYNVDGYGALN
ncbi:MAG: family 16 glycosylhydrolase [Rhodoluna sp.]|jgi:beta-glucanase (GH16 family)